MHQRALQFPPEGFPTFKLESGLPLVHHLGPPQGMGPAALPHTASILGINLGLRSTGHGKELVAMVVIPPHPVPGALLQINELCLSRHVDVIDALLGVRRQVGMLFEGDKQWQS